MNTVFLSKYVLFKICALSFFIYVQVQLSPLSHTTHACLSNPLHHPRSYPLVFSLCPLCMFIDDPSPILLHYYTPPILLVTLSLFFISMSLVMFCLLVCLVHPLVGEIIWYLSFNAWLSSLSIILSRSIHAVASSFFLSAA